MKGLVRAALLGCCALMTACSVTHADLPYDSSRVAPSRLPPRALVEIGSVADNRSTTPNWLGAIRGGFGQPLQTIVTERPVSDVVRSAFTDGLKARGLNGAGSQYSMRLDIEKLDCSQYWRREAHAHIGVSVINKVSGQVAYQRKVVADRVVGSELFDRGLFADTEDLRKVANATLQDAIDQTLDDPKFVALVR